MLMSPNGIKPTCLYVRYLVAMGWKADFEQAASALKPVRGQIIYLRCCRKPRIVQQRARYLPPDEVIE